MAEDSDDSQKTEEPTQKRLDDARQKGQIPLSREINHVAILLALAGLVSYILPKYMEDVSIHLRGYFEAGANLAADDFGVMADTLTETVGRVFGGLVPFLAVLMLLAFLPGFLQTGGLFSGESLTPKFDKISPMAGIKRLFSMKNLVEFLKGLGKLIIVSMIAWMLISPKLDDLDVYIKGDFVSSLEAVQDITVQLVMTVVVIMTVVAIADYLYQRLSHIAKLKMSQQDIKDEHKQSEGDPHIKARLRQLRMEKARKRMMQQVPKADVVITNPTHFAVALQYDGDTMQAPVVIAKGADTVAYRIRELAKEHKIEIVSNPPLARSLYAEVELDEAIPPELYKAVAEVISYVYKMKKGGR